MFSKKWILLLFVLTLIISAGTASVFGADPVTKDTKDASVDVYYPSACRATLPVVFFVHNGGAKKEDWGDYPQELAAKGFVTASIGWSEFSGSDDIASAINNVMKNNADKSIPPEWLMSEDVTAASN